MFSNFHVIWSKNKLYSIKQKNVKKEMDICRDIYHGFYERQATRLAFRRAPVSRQPLTRPFPWGMTGARVRIPVLSFFPLAPLGLLCRRVHPLLKFSSPTAAEQPFRHVPVNIASSRRFAILNPCVVSARVWQLVNGLIRTADFNVLCVAQFKRT